ncbi:hypothetical protein FACS1894147_03490 [Spirochaetia bacterium]|nr:hypothetical protein FACS1894147_03490 [Spirochaetia bacterium]
MASNTITIRDFFNNKFFEIPKYQRGYAWENQNIDDLFEDINEAVSSQSNHYIGTIVLSKDKLDKNKFYIVDGQQRVTTVSLIIQAIVNGLDDENRSFFKRIYIKEGPRYRLEPLNRDKHYFDNIMEGSIGEPQNNSQHALKNAVERIALKVNPIKDKLTFLKAVEDLQIMEFVENTEGDAIRIFQTVNDRGKLLTNIEKAKSLLIYFSNRYLQGTLDSKISDDFSDIFELFDDIKQLGISLNINRIKNVTFNEDTILSDHFITFSTETYTPSSSYVLQYLKRKLQEKRNSLDALEAFILNYILGLKDFFVSFKQLLTKTSVEPKYYKLFSILQVSATLYPLIIKLNQLSKLEESVSLSNKRKINFLEIIELIDIRVYKPGGNFKADICRFTCNFGKEAYATMQWLLWFNGAKMSKEQFRGYFNSRVYGNTSLPYIFICYNETLNKKLYTIDELKEIMQTDPTIEHILSQTPDFDPLALGFENEEDYLEYEHKIGNLSLLEKTLNSLAQNKVPLDKTKIYDRSKFSVSHETSVLISDRKGFTKNDIIERTNVFSTYVIDRWWCDVNTIKDNEKFIISDEYEEKEDM